MKYEDVKGWVEYVDHLYKEKHIYSRFLNEVDSILHNYKTDNAEKLNEIVKRCNDAYVIIRNMPIKFPPDTDIDISN